MESCLMVFPEVVTSGMSWSGPDVRSHRFDQS